MWLKRSWHRKTLLVSRKLSLSDTEQCLLLDVKTKSVKCWCLKHRKRHCSCICNTSGGQDIEINKICRDSHFGRHLEYLSLPTGDNCNITSVWSVIYTSRTSSTIKKNFNRQLRLIAYQKLTFVCLHTQATYHLRWSSMSSNDQGCRDDQMWEAYRVCRVVSAAVGAGRCHINC